MMAKTIVKNPTKEEPHPTGYPSMAKLLYMAVPNNGKAQANAERQRELPANTEATYFGYDNDK